MLRVLGNPKTLCTGVTRRDLLHIGGLSLFGLSLHDLLLLKKAKADEARRTSGHFGQAKACILIYKYGSPPQHETYDPKPDAPSAIQGEMRAIPTNVAGVAVGEGLPKIASIADRLTFVRSLTHPFPLHGTVYATTGIPNVDTKIEAKPRDKRQWPFIGSIVDYLDERRTGNSSPAMPRNIAMPFMMGSKNEYPPLAGPYGAFLGTRYDPVYTDFMAKGTRVAPAVRPGKSFHDPQLSVRPEDRLQLAGTGTRHSDVSPRRFDLRRSLLSQFDEARRWLDDSERVSTYSGQQRMAYSCLLYTSPSPRD